MGLVAPRDYLSLKALPDIRTSVRGQACPRAVAAHIRLLPGTLGSSERRQLPFRQIEIRLCAKLPGGWGPSNSHFLLPGQTHRHSHQHEQNLLWGAP